MLLNLPVVLGIVGVMVVLRLKSIRDTFAYGPYLAAGTLYSLFVLGSH